MLFSDSIGITIIEPINVEHDFIDSLFCSERFFNLFKCNISNPNLQKLDDIMYFFRKNEGIKDAFVKGKFQTIFKSSSQELFSTMSENLRKSLLGNIDYLRFDKFLELVNNLESKLYKFIKIK